MKLSIITESVTYGKKGLAKSYQANFPPETKCCRCGGKSTFAFTVMENSEPYTCDQEHPEGLWPHDAVAVAIYFCSECLETTALYNQA